VCTRRIPAQIPAKRGLTEQVDIEKGKVTKAVKKTSLEIKEGICIETRNWFGLAGWQAFTPQI